MPTRSAQPQSKTRGEVGPYTFEEFASQVERFHGYQAPGVLLGGIMVDEALRHLPAGILFDAISETSWCLPDAVQMLTPCTIGNGWMRIMNFGVYAVSLFDKRTGQGFRVVLDPAAMEPVPHMRAWLLKEKPKKEQDSPALRLEIAERGRSVLRVEAVTIREEVLIKRSKGAISLCPICGDAYPKAHGALCRSCQGESPYAAKPEESVAAPKLRLVPVAEAVGKTVIHDMTRIEPGEWKGVAFHRGQRLSAGDVCQLQRMGKFHVYVEDENLDQHWVHEDTAAGVLAKALAGEGVDASSSPHEGKINLTASRDGLFVVDENRLQALNLVPDVMAATRHGFSPVKADMRVAGVRAIPLHIARTNLDKALRILADGPLLTVRPMATPKVGILVTGNEVFQGIIEDRFEAIITSKVTAYGCPVAGTRIAPDATAAIRAAAQELIGLGAELIITTAGLSVDPDDVTRKGLMEAGVTDLLYGAPVLPGSMMLLARLGQARVIGVPACALYFKTTALDLVLPRVLAGLDITRQDLSRLAVGGMCLECKNCTFPKCPLGK